MMFVDVLATAFVFFGTTLLLDVTVMNSLSYIWGLWWKWNPCLGSSTLFLICIAFIPIYLSQRHLMANTCSMWRRQHQLPKPQKSVVVWWILVANVLFYLLLQSFGFVQRYHVCCLLRGTACCCLNYVLYSSSYIYKYFQNACTVHVNVLMRCLYIENSGAFSFGFCLFFETTTCVHRCWTICLVIFGIILEFFCMLVICLCLKSSLRLGLCLFE